MNTDLTQSMHLRLVQRRNNAVLKAYQLVLASTKHYLASLLNEDYRFIVEIDRSNRANDGGLTIYEASSPVCYLSLTSDNKGLYWITFGIQHTVEREITMQFLRMLFKHTNTGLVKDALTMDFIFLNVKDIYELAIQSVPISSIQYLQPDRPTVYDAMLEAKQSGHLPHNFLQPLNF